MSWCNCALKGWQSRKEAVSGKKDETDSMLQMKKSDAKQIDSTSDSMYDINVNNRLRNAQTKD